MKEYRFSCQKLASLCPTAPINLVVADRRNATKLDVKMKTLSDYDSLLRGIAVSRTDTEMEASRLLRPQEVLAVCHPFCCIEKKLDLSHETAADFLFAAGAAG